MSFFIVYSVAVTFIDYSNSCYCFVHMSDFTCSTNYSAGTYLAENDEVAVTCGVKFAGGWEPELTCDVIGQKLRENPTSSSDISDVTSVFRVKVVKEFNNRSITCRIRFTDATKPTSSLQVAENVPVYDSLWTADALLVTCKSTRRSFYNKFQSINPTFSQSISHSHGSLNLPKE